MNTKRASRLLWPAVIGIMAVLFSCSKYDDSALTEKISDIEARVSKLETMVKTLTSDLNSLSTICFALQDEDRLVSYTEKKEGGVVTGYFLNFSKSGTISISNGEDGHSPSIGVKKSSDGLWYWTVDGQFVKDESGKMIQASGLTPKLKIDDDYWYVSYDDGKTWTNVGKATGEDGDSFFKSVTETDESVCMILSDGTVINIPKLKKIGIEFDDSEDIGIMPGGQRTISYTVTDSNSPDVVVRAMGQNGWRAKAQKNNNTSGTITVWAPDPITDDEIIVLVYDGEYSTIFRALNFIEGTINIPTNQYEVNGKGDVIDVPVKSNLGVTVQIPAAAKRWISYDCTETRAMKDYAVTLKIEKNVDDGDRYAVISITDESNKISKDIVIYQKEYEQFTDLSGGRETANCYIINSPGDYKFPIIKGNGSKGVILSGDTAEITGAESADIVWQTPSFITAVGIKKGFLTFSTSATLPHGNAVVAVKNASGEILWSWHIWSTDYVLGQGDIEVKNYYGTRSYHMMPLNLGALSKSNSSNDSYNRDAALFYQFGRKDPFPAESATNTSAGGSLKLSILHPDTYYTWNNYGDWCSDRRMDWWDSGSTNTSNYSCSSASDANTFSGYKTIYDPCPAGYRVPPDDAFTGFTVTGTSVSGIYSVNGSFNYSSMAYSFNTGYGNTINFKLCGGLNASAGTYLRYIGYYQTAHAAGLGSQRQLIMTIDEVDPMCYQYSRALAGAVRPVKDNYVAPYESKDYSLDGTTVTLQNHKSGNGGAKILIVGDGFLDKDIASGEYDKRMAQAYQYFFSVEPFKSLKDYFDVVSMRSVSRTNTFDSNTAYQCKFGEGTDITCSLSDVYKSAFKVYDKISDLLVIVVINDKRYAGTCWMSTNGTCVALVPMSEEYWDFEDVIHHEACGHGFGLLGDEYYYSGTMTDNDITDLKSWQNYGFYLNVDVTNDPSNVKWAKFLSDNVYKNYTGIYEGAYTFAYGAYRSTNNSIMRHNTGEFNPPSRYLIYNRIMSLCGQSYSWDSFVEYDSRNLTSSSSAYADKSDDMTDFVPLAPPEIVDAEAIWRESLKAADSPSEDPYRRGADAN